MNDEQSLTRRGFIAAGVLAGLQSTTDAAIPRDQPRELMTTKADLGTNDDVIQRIVNEQTFQASFLQARFQSLAEFKQVGREKVLNAFGYRPEKVEPKAEVLERVDMGKYTREKIVFSTSPHFRVPAYLLIPKGLKQPAPGIVDLHSHGGMFLFGKEKVIDLGDNHPTMTDYHKRNYERRPTATELVKRGYVVIVIDAFMFGERRVMVDADMKFGWDRSQYQPDDVTALNNRCRAKEATIVKGLTLGGITWPGIVTWDDIRTVDYLCTRPEVDPKRIGCLGVSFGGHRTLFLAGLDERIAAACVVGFMSTVKPMLKAHLDTHSFVHFVPQLHQWLDLPDVVSMMAPKPLLVQQCRQDGLFPLSGMKEAVEQIAAVYKKANVEKQFTGKFYDVPHIFNQHMQDDAFAFLDRTLKPQGN